MMAVWYMVKRLDTGKVYGHDTWFHGSVPDQTVTIGHVEAQRHRDGRPHHLIVYVDARNEDEAQFMARVSFDLWGEESA
jgi:hypothetical protein